MNKNFLRSIDWFIKLVFCLIPLKKDNYTCILALNIFLIFFFFSPSYMENADAMDDEMMRCYEEFLRDTEK